MALTAVFVFLAVVGGLMVAEGVALFCAPAALIVLGVEALAAAYAGLYVAAKDSS